MSTSSDYDENLWFEHLGCEGKHYIIGNPHTYTGRMWAWCPLNNRSFFVSKGDMGDMSEMMKYWINGYLHGSEPSPPMNEEGDVDFTSLAYKLWQKETALFVETGYWHSGSTRKCTMCLELLLASEPCDTCGDCRRMPVGD